MRLVSMGTSALAVCVAFVLGACSRGSDGDLWHRDFSKQPTEAAAPRPNELTGYWEGQVAMGAIRAKIEAAQITLAIRCDRNAKVVAQGGAPIVVKPELPPKIALQADLLSTGDEKCGFRFAKGSEFSFYIAEPGVLRFNFAGTSTSDLRKLAELEPAK